MKTTLFTIERDAPGTLSTMARPRGGDWLEDELRALKETGVDVIVSFLTSSEEFDLELENERTIAGSLGLQFISLPTTDRGLPERTPFLALVETTLEYLRNERHVVAHCRMGIGRSSLLAAAVLMREGMPSTDAWKTIAKARGMNVPDTQAQQAWVNSLF